MLIKKLLLVGAFMTFQILATITLENFDDAWSLGDPVKIEEKLQELLPQAEAKEVIKKSKKTVKKKTIK